ncbi:MAG: HipA domain-containing protein [Lachnospiraceae bacterium]|nr:HipA domain-containing protein [Lachnospiraceae bacterium]
MIRYLVNLEKNGTWIRVGSIDGEGGRDARFSYADAYLEDPSSAAVSVSLPLRKEAFSPQQTRTFFDGLLPEGFTRRAVAAWMRTDEDDYLSILFGLGCECLGAIRISRGEEEEESSYRPLSMEEVQALAAEGATKSAELVLQSHLSLTGASGKVGLYHDAAGGGWFLPTGTAPSTHIVKQSHIRLNDIVANEQLCERTAYYLGIDVPESFIINTGAGQEHEVLFAAKRFDRFFSDRPALLQGLPVPQRLHQEDMAQALGIPAAAKYEQDPSQGYLARLFDLLRRVSSNPIEDTLRLWDRIVFCRLAGNTDAHLKNYSLLYSPNLGGIRLAPAYDLVSTCVYEAGTRKMAFSIGGESDIRKVTDESFRHAAGDARIGERMAMRRLAEMKERFPGALRKAMEELSEEGYERAQELGEKILKGF